MNKIFVDIEKFIYFRNFCFYAADQKQARFLKFHIYTSHGF